MIALAALSVVSLGAGATALKVGDRAPDFTANTADAGAVHLADYVGKSNVVLYFYPKDDTPGCTKQACAVRDDFAAFGDLDAVVIGISFDTAESHRAFADKYQLPFRLLADTNKAIAKAYGAADKTSAVARRMTFIIGQDGKIAYVNPQVNPATHSAEIREALAALKK
ncbi:peroxiredoxin [bacterium]|nr:peroxiredoxin [bacterium]